MKWIAVIGVGIIAVAAGCSSGASERTTGCGQVSVDRWAEAGATSPEEPAVRLPQPPDWKRVNWPDADVRLLLRDDKLGERLPPSVLVMITDETGRAPNPQAVVDTVRNNINRAAPTELSETPGTVCGFEGATFTYKSANGAPVTRAMKTVVIVPHYDNRLFHVVVTAQAGDAGDAAMRDAQTILTGMEIKAPGPH
jgi:hypothetical protein